MKKEHFEPYKNLILKSIDSCVQMEQLACCNDMMLRFRENFLLIKIDMADINAAMEELSTAYLQKSNELHIY